MKTATQTARKGSWITPVRSFALGVSALCAVSFAPAAHAVATFSAITDVTLAVTGITATGGPADVLILGTASPVAGGVGTFTTNGGTATATSTANNIPLIMAVGDSITAVATVTGRALGEGSSAIANSLNDLSVILVNNTPDVATTIDFVLSYTLFAQAATEVLGDFATAVSEVALTDDLGLFVNEFFQAAAIAFDGSAQTVAPGPQTFAFSIVLDALNPTAGLSVLAGTADASGSAFGVPEPGSLLLLGIGLAGLGYARRRMMPV